MPERVAGAAAASQEEVDEQHNSNRDPALSAWSACRNLTRTRQSSSHESLGFDKRTDIPVRRRLPLGGGLPAGGDDRDRAAPARPASEVTPAETGITLTTADIDATHAALQARGVDVDAEVARMGDPVPPMFWLRDPAGHSLMVVQQR